MQTLTAAAKAALIAGCPIAQRVDILDSGIVIGTVSVVEGGVNVDVTAAIRRTLAVTVANTGGALLPLVTSKVAPVGYELAAYAGPVLPDGTTILLPQGVFGIRRAEVAHPGLIRITGADRSQRISDAILLSPYNIAAGVNYGTAIQNFISAGVPGLTFSPSAWSTLTTRTTPILAFAEGDNRLQRAKEMAQSIGFDVYMDLAGNCTMAAIPDVGTAAPVWSFTVGAGAATMNAVTQTLDRGGAASHAVVIGQASGFDPVRSDAYDTDPVSLTYWRGRFGDVPIRQTSNYITSQGQADEASAALLRQNQGIVENVGVTVGPLVALDGYDVVTITDPLLGIDAHYVLTTLPIPLHATTMQLATKARRIK